MPTRALMARRSYQKPAVTAGAMPGRSAAVARALSRTGPTVPVVVAADGLDMGLPGCEQEGTITLRGAHRPRPVRKAFSKPET
jgi:hypothetical protein